MIASVINAHIKFAWHMAVDTKSSFAFFGIIKELLFEPGHGKIQFVPSILVIGADSHNYCALVKGTGARI